MQVSVIIVNYNVRAFLENSLNSVLKALKGIDGEIIVVDNASDDGSIEMVRQKFPQINLMVNNKNVGFAAANNQGIRISKGEYLLLLNPDTILQENTIKIMLNFLERNKDVGLAGCKILNPDGSLQLACRRSFPSPWVAFTKIIGLSNLFPRVPLFGKYNLEYLDPEKSYEVDAVSGSFMFVRRKVAEEVGGLDEQFFMYGEDLDWCYRIKEAGWKIYYVHETQVIHYKGESVRRSNIDEVKLFYEAMRLFVKKHFSRGIISTGLLSFGIAVRELAALISKSIRQLQAPISDFVFVNLSLLVGEYIWFGEILHFPSHAYPVIFIVPALIIISSMYFFGIYTKRKLSATHASGAVIFGYIILSALTFFFKQYAFSRMVVAISGVLNFFLLPGWRLIARSILKSPEHQKRSLFGRRTLIVGVDKKGEELLRKLRTRVDDGYEVVGFIDMSRKYIGEQISGVEILGSIDNIGKIIEEKRVSDVIFSTDSLPYTDILTVIARGTNRAVNFRMVPSSLDVIVGKTHIDELDDIPLVDIDYNINKTSRRILKRIFDIIIAGILLLLVYPFILIRKKSSAPLGKFGKTIILIPDVMKGKLSLVGPPNYLLSSDDNKMHEYCGKYGVTGLVQLNYRNDLTIEEIENYNLYYAKNQSLILDFEILIKTITMIIKKERNY
ncbi:MAG: glycosyltransferase [Ignavibacteriales bacterium]|nr:glycosyltransferase [Ignavibacteriales bacterium]